MLYLDRHVYLDRHELISTMVRYFADDIKERRRIGYQFHLPLCQADATSILL